MIETIARKVDERLLEKGNSNSHGARPVHLTITIIKRIWTRRLSLKTVLLSDVCLLPLSLSPSQGGSAACGGYSGSHTPQRLRTPRAFRVLVSPSLDSACLTRADCLTHADCLPCSDLPRQGGSAACGGCRGRNKNQRLRAPRVLCVCVARDRPLGIRARPDPSSLELSDEKVYEP